MNRITVMSLAFLLGSLPFAGQTSGRQSTGSAVLRSPDVQTSCPVDIQVQRLIYGRLTPAVLEKGPPKGVAQKLRMTVRNPKAVGIAAIRITVYGSNGGATAPAVAYNFNPAAASRIFDVPITVGAGKDASTDILVRGFTAVSFIDVNSVDYADGSRWSSKEDGICQAYPRSWL